MNSITVKLAEEVATAIGELGAEYPVEVSLAPDLSFEEISTRQIIVTPQSHAIANATRAEIAATVKINVCLCEKIAATDVDSRLAIMETIVALFERKRLSSAIVTSVEFSPIYDASLMRTSRIFCSICTLTLRFYR